MMVEVALVSFLERTWHRSFHGFLDQNCDSANSTRDRHRLVSTTSTLIYMTKSIMSPCLPLDDDPQWLENVPNDHFVVQNGDSYVGTAWLVVREEPRSSIRDYPYRQPLIVAASATYHQTELEVGVQCIQNQLRLDY